MSNESTFMRHARITYPKPQVWASHPYVNKANHASLLEYLQQRLLVGRQARDSELPRLVSMDRKVAGWIKLSAEDQKRANKSEDTGEPFATKMNLPLAFIHLDDMMTYYAETFAPSRGMFYQTGNPTETDQAQQIVVKMNNDAIYSGYFREVLSGIFSTLKYNRGGFVVTWGTDSGPKMAREGEQLDTTQEVKWMGNRLEALDMYNTFTDPSVHPSKLHSDGEFAGFAKLRSRYWLQSRVAAGGFYNCEEYLKESGNLAGSKRYYVSPPTEAHIAQGDHAGNARGTDWVSILSENSVRQMDGCEIVTLLIRLNPTEFGLVGQKTQTASRNGYEIWRFDILDDCYIINAQQMNNVHNHIPFYIGLVHDDAMGVAQKSVGELLKPLQDFASFLLNVHLEASRSALFGITFYDPLVIPFDKVPKGEVSARIAINPAGTGKDISKSIWQHNSTLETKQTMQDLESVMAIINQFFPTQSLPSQIASIDRAVSSQVAAVQQGSNRRQQKTARLLDDSIFSKVRYAMYYNILQYQPSESDITDFYTGKSVKLDMTKLKDTNLPFIIGQGLKAIDRQAMVQQMQSLIFALIQSPKASEGIDVLGLIDFWTSLMDVEVDMNQFRIQPPAPEGQPQVPGAPATGAAVAPATNPNEFTAPIYGEGPK